MLFPGLELESLPLVFAGSDSTSASSSRFTDMVIPAKGWEVGGRRFLKGGDFFKGSNGGDYWKKTINRGTAIILENTVTSNTKKICSFHSMGTIRVTKKKKGTLIAMRL